MLSKKSSSIDSNLQKNALHEATHKKRRFQSRDANKIIPVYTPVFFNGGINRYAGFYENKPELSGKNFE